MRSSIYILAVFLLSVLPIPTAQAKDIPETLVITNSNSWPPYSFAGENGEPRGLLVDLWREFERQNNVKIEFILADWADTLKLIQERKVMAHAGLFESAQRSKYLDFTHPLSLPLNTRLFISTKLNIKGLSDMGNISIAVTKGGYVESFLNRLYPGLILVPYPNSREGIEAAVRGKHLAFATDYPAAMYHLHRLDAYDKFYVADTLYTKKLSVGVPKGQTELLEFIEHGMAKIPPQEFDRITQKWIQTTTITPEWLMPTAVSGLVIMVGGFVFIYIYFLKRQVAARTMELQKMSQTDMLTGLYNRRKMDEVLQREFDRFKRYKRPLSLILIDIDNFKEINDTYGHAVGDKVLVRFAGILLSSTRSMDRIGRWGGEEFIIVCPETTVSEGVIIAEKLRSHIENSQFNTIGGSTASFGVTEIKDDDDFISIFVRCDAALYKSKENGRNRVSEG
ncbi:diguanylate cyclase [Desulfovibrio sp. JC022]|uniref:transporter substrate-binding domain-containing diguanylate cyclase n=1 Tax=Desulfovibrio sp. JC022 TaxID=2593642 RepID=UPI0013D7CF73|nr:sensor domain-containing diguanylate cyclase [Desulfovibrio sp. JC022]